MEWELDFSEQIRASKWSAKRKRSIDCDNPKGFSQKQYCKRQKRGGAYKSKGDEKEYQKRKKTAPRGQNPSILIYIRTKTQRAQSKD